MDQRKLRAWWSHRQGLDGSMMGATPAEVLARSGWSRSVGGVGPYLTLFARARTSRADADAAVATLAIHELPSARGCTYVLPSVDFALGLAVGDPFGDGEMKQAMKLGVTEQEVASLCAAVLRVLGKGVLSPEDIRVATGSLSRSLGAEGKKKGLTTTLPLALGRLQTRGDIRRVPVNGRLDQQRYAYARWSPNPRTAAPVEPSPAFVDLARRYFRWVGPATLGEFQWFSGLGVKTTKEAVAPLGLVPAAKGSERLLLPDDLAPFTAFSVPSNPQYALVSSLDTMSAARRDFGSMVDDVSRYSSAVSDRALTSRGGMADLPCHAILDRGRLIGFWEYDVDKQSIVSALFGGSRDHALSAAIHETESYVREQLGDARSFSLDSPASRAPKIEALRRM